MRFKKDIRSDIETYGYWLWLSPSLMILVMLLVFLATEHLATTLLAVISVLGDFNRALGTFLVAFGS